MKRRTPPKLLSLGVAFALPLVASAQGPETGISGTVKDQTGRVIVGAKVTLRDAGGAPLMTAETDGRGAYSLAGVGPGPYTLFIFQDGFAPVIEEIRVDIAPAVKDFVLRVAAFAEEVTVSFTGEQARTALKMDAPVRDVPLSVKSYTTSFVRALDANHVGDLYTYMSGINRTGFGVADAAMRGFTYSAETFNVQLNGMPGFTSRFNSPNIANLERVEVLKGPASVLYGRTAPGGLVNLITKRPLDHPQHLVDLRLGSFAGTGPRFGEAASYRLGADLTGPIGKGQRLLYRLIGSYEKSESFRDFVRSEDFFVAPSLTWNISGRTVLTVEGEYRHVDGSLDQGLIAPQNDIDLVAPITTRYQEPGDWEKDGGWSVTAYFTKGFGRGWDLNATWRTAFQEDERFGFENNRVESDNRRVRRRDRDQFNRREYYWLDTTLSNTFRTGALSHSLLLGMGGGYQYYRSERRRFNNLGFFVDMYQPRYGLYALPANPNPGSQRLFPRWNYDVYLQDRVDFGPRWKGLFALRYDRLDTSVEPLRAPDVPPGSRTDDAWVPTMGLVFQPDARWSVYGSMASSFEPVGASVGAADPLGPLDFKPERGIQFETGVKAELAQGRADATLAVYRITKRNAIVPLAPDVNIQTGQERSQGVEIDLRLKPSAHFQAILGYTYNDARITEDTRPVLVGSRLRNAPKHGFNVWGRYDIASGTAKGLGFGLGLIYRSDRAGSVTGQPLRDRGPAYVLLPAYFRMDTGLYFVRGRCEVTLRGNNVFDEIYYEAGNTQTGILPGRPRELTLSLRVRL